MRARLADEEAHYRQLAAELDGSGAAPRPRRPRAQVRLRGAKQRRCLDARCALIIGAVVAEIVVLIVGVQILSDHHAPAAPSDVNVHFRVESVVLSRMRNAYSCVSLDWWPADKCDYGDCSWAGASLLTANLSDPLLYAAVRALAPVTLRVGGSLADQVVYADVPGQASPADCPPFVRDHGYRIGFRGGCLRWARWLEIHDFCARAGCSILFSVNALRGRTRAACEPGTLCRDLKGDARPACCTDYSGAWDSRNLRELILASARAGRRPSMLAFGNELVGEKAIEAHLPAAQYAKELRELGAIAREAWPTSPPRRVAPDANFDDAWLGAFFSEFYDGAWPATLDDAAPLHTISHHLYSLGAGDASELQAKILDPKKLDGAADKLRKAVRFVQNRTGGAAECAISESGGAYNSGQRGATDAFVSGFWWHDLMGLAASTGHGFACRQTIVGGRYALLDLATRQPAPDFWNTLLWRVLMSPKALRAVRFTRAHDGPMHLRSYVHCARAGSKVGGHLVNAHGGVAVLLLNLAPATTHHVTVDNLPAAAAAAGEAEAPELRRLDFLLTATANGTSVDDLSSRTIHLNHAARPLSARPDGSLPLDDLRGEAASGTLVSVPPLSYGFYVFPEAGVKVCLTSRQAELSRQVEAADGVKHLFDGAG